MSTPRVAWIILACAFAIQFTFSGVHFTFGVFLKPISDELEWTRGATAFGYTLMWWVSSPAAIFLGWVSDRIGSRVVLAFGAVVFSIGLFLSGTTHQLWQFYLGFGVLAGLGRASARAPLLSAVMQFFDKRRGLAMGITLSGTGVGTVFFPPLVRYVISVADWRMAFMVLAALSAIIVIPAALFIRGPRPGEVEGDAQQTGRDEAAHRESVLDTPVHGWTVGAVLRNKVFWVFCVAGTACCISHSLPLAHIVAYATDQGISEFVAASLLGVVGASAAAGRLTWGIVSDRVGARRTVFICVVAQTVLIFVLGFTESLAALYAFAAGYGFSYGGVLPLYAVVTRELYGMKRFGTIYGMNSFLTSIGMGMGGLVGGYLFDLYGEYFQAFMASVGLGLIAIAGLGYIAALKRPGGPTAERVLDARSVGAVQPGAIA